MNLIVLSPGLVKNSKIMFCGDATQSDLLKDKERNGIADFMKILRIMPSVDIIEFGVSKTLFALDW